MYSLLQNLLVGISSKDGLLMRTPHLLKGGLAPIVLITPCSMSRVTCRCFLITNPPDNQAIVIERHYYYNSIISPHVTFLP